MHDRLFVGNCANVVIKQVNHLVHSVVAFQFVFFTSWDGLVGVVVPRCRRMACVSGLINVGRCYYCGESE